MNRDELYVGQDALINFGKKKTFAGELKTDKSFGINIVNNDATDVTVAFCPAHYKGLGDIQKKFPGIDAILNDGVIYSNGGNDLVASSLDPSNSIAEWIAWMIKNPTRIPEIFVETTKTKFFATTIFQKEVNPYMDKGDKRIYLPNYVKSKDFHRDVKHVPLYKTDQDLYFHDSNVIQFTIPANSDITFRFAIGAEMNFTRMFEELSALGRENVLEMGAQL